jgi:hypothetical protein
MPLIGLARLVQDKGYLKLWAIDCFWVVLDRCSFGVGYFMGAELRIQSPMADPTIASIPRIWCVFPSEVRSEQLEALRVNLANFDYQLALERIHNDIKSEKSGRFEMICPAESSTMTASDQIMVKQGVKSLFHGGKADMGPNKHADASHTCSEK